MRLTREEQKACGIPPITEGEFQRQVISLARAFGWKVAHFRPGLTQKGRWCTAVQADGKGFPDLVLVKPVRGWRLVAELKVGKNKTSPEQRDWLVWFEQCGVPSYEWRPADWPEIRRVLERGPDVEEAKEPAR